MVGKFYSIKDEASIKKGTIISTLFASIVAGGCYFLGGFGRLYEEKMVSGGFINGGKVLFDKVIPTMLGELAPVIVALVIVLVLSASMSTLSSLVLTSSSTLTLDLIKGHVVKDMNEKRQLLWMRGLLVVFVAISAAIALIQYNSSITFIAQLMGISWGAIAGAFLGPFLFGLYWKRVSKAAVWASFIIGVGLTSGNMIAGMLGSPWIASPINCGALAMILSLVVTPLISLVTPAVPFEIAPVHQSAAIDREYRAHLAEEGATVDAIGPSSALEEGIGREPGKLLHPSRRHEE
jgi:SSS family solute:Na+ symporter/sodium/proline symporter